MALVITIIVLLILAGVTIALVVGENGILLKVQDAKKHTALVQTKEQIKLAIIASRMDGENDFKINETIFEEELRNDFGEKVIIKKQGENNSLPWIITVDEYKFEASSNGVEEIITDGKAEIGDYVEYDVSYSDMYTRYEFSKSDGWRIISTGTKNSDGTYSNAKIVSTGVPAKLYYYSDSAPTVASNASSLWWGNLTLVNSENGLNLESWSKAYSPYFTIYGLKHNFSSIPFSNTDTNTYNTVYYTAITNKEATSTTTGDIFKTSQASEVHNLSLEEINETRGYDSLDMTQVTLTSDGDTGLFYLKDLANENTNYKYTESTRAYYWLATVLTARSNYYLAMAWYNGAFDGTNEDATIGIRPVITLNANIRELTEGYWEICQY